MRHLVVAAFALLLVSAPLARAGGTTGPRYGLSLFGKFKYPADFTHFDYTRPDAPKGGTVKLAAIGTFDTLNPFTLRGMSAAGIGNIFDTLMVSPLDEISTEYGLIAESVELAPDRSWIIFHLRPQARFHDGTPITPEDVLWTVETLRTKGHPAYRIQLADVIKSEKIGLHAVKFTFRNGDNREIPLFLGQLPVLSKRYWQNRKFENTTLDIPVGSGPYTIESFEPGRNITYKRVKDYWAANLPVRRGSNNFDIIRYDYYRDMSIALEAFKAGQFDFRQEFTAKDWATGYNSPALRAGLFTKAEIPNEIPEGMQAFVYNTRRPIFRDPLVRRALAYAFDFQWTNKHIMYGAYKRIDSYFENSPFASRGLPGPDELKLLDRYRGEIPDEVFTGGYQPPKTDGSGNIRRNLLTALHLLKQAGWSIKGGRLVNDKTGQPFEFEMMIFETRSEPIVLPFKQNLARLGIDMRVRVVDPTQYENRLRNWDFDMITYRWPGSAPPGNELREFFGSEAAKTPGTLNYPGISSPAVDGLIEKVANALKWDDLIVAAHALDRVLLHGYYVIPQWYSPVFRVAYWNKFGRPKVTPKYGIGFDTWWIDQERATVTAQKKQEIQEK
jgi:microcin C transport system substrate-binding protein